MKIIYLDNAATSWPKPGSVYREVSRCMRSYCGNPGRGGHKMAVLSGEKVYECREGLAKLFGIKDPLDIVFTSNATQAINIGIKGVLKQGDHVIITAYEHNAVLRPLKKLEGERGIQISVVAPGADGLIQAKAIEKCIRKNTGLIIVGHASNVTGTINPVKEIGDIAKKHGILFMVDAAQTAGIVHIEVEEMNIALLAFPGHKGLLGPQGTGGLYIKKGSSMDTIIEGGTGSLSESMYQPLFSPDRFESGTLNTPGIAGLNEGVKYLLKQDLGHIMEQELSLSAILLEELSRISQITIYGRKDSRERVGVIAFNIEGRDSADICTELDKSFDIAVRGGLHCSYLNHEYMQTLKRGAVRLSVGCFNTEEEIHNFLAALRQIIKDN